MSTISSPLTVPTRPTDLRRRREILPEGKSAGFMIFRDMPHDAE